ncbi:phage/plasmid replication domain-containing protein [Rufibacter ruber]|uniref:phage/plasmid replication domain-containing protein n=1 Tax=Rufibacter ruber TaxID=1783499 RepID=UPI000B02F6D1|nr:phage/plasmid replication protein [Rufibacter ruber]
MVDTIKICKVGVIPHFQEFPLHNILPVICEETGEIIGSKGILGENLRIYYSNGCLSIKGSISRLHLGDNVNILQHSQLTEAFKRIEKELRVDLGEAKIKRLDLAANIEVPIKVNEYYRLLGSSKYYNRFVEKGSLYYNSGSRKMVFYDKRKEAKIKGHPANLMRFEVRWLKEYLKSWSKKTLGYPDLLVNDLLNPSTYNQLIRAWGDEYYSIHKPQIPSFNFALISKPKDIEKQLMLIGIETLGGYNAIVEMLLLSKAQHHLLYPEALSRIKANLRKISTLDNLTQVNNLIIRLDKEIGKIVSENLI